MSAGASHDVVVVGSINQDLGIGLDRTPHAGETVMGDDVVWSPGGKGANQAVGCARLGLDVAIVGALGRDAAGDGLATVLEAEGVDTRHVARVEAATGLAVVLVDRQGESTIVVSPGANDHVRAASVDAAADALSGARAVLCQLEIPVASVQRAAELANGPFVLNPAPGRPLEADLLARVDVLVPNRYELAQLTGGSVPASVDEVRAAVAQLRGPRVTVVTLGDEGAVVVADGDATHVPAVRVTPVDATGAGDSFCAALVTGLLEELPIVTAVEEAVRVAAVTTLRRGAMESLPRRAEIDGALTAARRSS